MEKQTKWGIALSGISILGAALTTGLAQRSADRKHAEAMGEARAPRRKKGGCPHCGGKKKPGGCPGCGGGHGHNHDH